MTFPAGRRAILAIPLLVAATLGCSSTATFQFRCDGEINNGYVLAIDVVRLTADEERRVRELGEASDKSWFLSPLRGEIGQKIQTVSVERGCDRPLEIPIADGDVSVAIIADYQFDAGDAAVGRLRIFPAKEVKGKKILIGVRNRELHVETAK
jgi:hypothetical protein